MREREEVQGEPRRGVEHGHSICRTREMQFTVVGNSLARGMMIEGFEVECRPGARLRELLERARERVGANRLVVIIFGIPDLRDEGIVR